MGGEMMNAKDREYMADRLWHIVTTTHKVNTELRQLKAGIGHMTTTDLLRALEHQNGTVGEMASMVRQLQNEIGKLELKLEGVEHYREVCRQEYESYLQEQAEQAAPQFSQMAGDI
jgi:hypothetical protein